ncbi:hypothetical protein SK128_013921 [Halocaridina rubra]|uniref:Protein-lysine N-methyltransferase SMYD4 n=1 Tax=Halocaridina rubra TaxID=373956 RepID=A0AAN8XDX0_HALRR
MAAEYEAFMQRIQEGLRREEEKATAAAATTPREPELARKDHDSSPPPLINIQETLTETQSEYVAPEPLLEPKRYVQASSFKELYEEICQQIRASGTLDIIMQDFQICRSDLDKVTYVSQLTELENLHLQENFLEKNQDDANNYEKVYDLLISNEASAAKAHDVMKKCIQKTPIDDVTSLAVRYMKRGWAFLLLEEFENAASDAKKSLSFGTPEDQIWNAHEILGHVNAQQNNYKQSEFHFVKALENLRKSNVINEVKAAVTVRIMTVFKTVKSKKGKKPSEEKRSGKDTPRLPKVAYGVHKSFPSASAALEFIVTKERGRCTIAKRDIRPGDVLIVDSPYCTVLNPDYLTTHCFHCYQRAPAAVPCNSCAKVCYCSEECRLASWNGLHASECRVLNHLLEPGIGKMAFIAYRILTTLTWSKLQTLREEIDALVETELQEDIVTFCADGTVQSEASTESSQAMIWKGQYLPHDYKTILHMASNSSKRTFGDIFKRAITAYFVTQCLKVSGYFGTPENTQEDELFVASLVLRHLQSSSCNAYEISEFALGSEGITGSQMLDVGGALYSTVSLTNHSCVANTSRYSIGDKCVLKAIRPIPKGSEVFDNYGFHYYVSTVNERQDVLLNQYKFTCMCAACENMWSLYPHHPTETLIFRCPAPSCGAACCYSQTSRSKCNMCGNHQEFLKLLKDIETQLLYYKDALSKLQRGNYQAALPVLLTHLEFIEAHVVLPVKHFTDLQEALKQCYNYMGNIYNPHKQTEPQEAVESPQPKAVKLKGGKNKYVNPNKK